jgi:hypothetical protein
VASIQCAQSLPLHRIVWIDCPCASQSSKPGCNRSLNAVVRAALQATDSAFVITSSRAELTPHNDWYAWCDVLHKRAVDHVEKVHPDIQLRAFEIDDIGFVLPHLVQSIVLGIPSHVRASYSATIGTEMARERLWEILAADSLALIAVLKDQPIGYCFATFEGNYTHIHDTLAIPGQEQKGVSTYLHRVVEAASFHRNIFELKGTLSLDSQNCAAALMCRLQQAGWCLERRHFVVPRETALRDR